jgi:hypothetical protein
VLIYFIINITRCNTESLYPHSLGGIIVLSSHYLLGISDSQSTLLIRKCQFKVKNVIFLFYNVFFMGEGLISNTM